MKNIAIILSAATAMFTMWLLQGCAATEGIERDARDTPIGSVIAGDTKNSDEYIQRVKQRNKAATKSAWQPESPDRM